LEASVILSAEYRAYIASDEWRDVKRRYRSSKLPQKCHVCGSLPVDLHHKSYKRFGNERLNDLLPLCRACHEAAHAFLKQPECSKKLTLWTIGRRLRKFHARHGKLPTLGGKWGVRQEWKGRRA
jgi:hypothetical protein